MNQYRWRKNRLKDLQKNAWSWAKNNGHVFTDEKSGKDVVNHSSMVSISCNFNLCNRTLISSIIRKRNKNV